MPNNPTHERSRTNPPFRKKFQTALAILCGAKPPLKLVDYWIVGSDKHLLLQDWAASHKPIFWASGIGLIEAAQCMAETPHEYYSNVE